MRLDKLELKFWYKVSALSENAFIDYRSHVISADHPVTLFGSAGDGRGGTFAPSRHRSEPAPLTLHGKWHMHRFQDGRTSFKIELFANPTRTIRHAMSLVGTDELEALDPFAFFLHSTEDYPGTNDSNDNFVTLSQGHWHEPMGLAHDAWSNGLRCFCDKLTAFMDEAVAPRSFGFEQASTGRFVSPTGVSVWREAAEPSIKSAEAYIERNEHDAVMLMSRLAPRALAAFREARATRYALPSAVENEEDQAPSIGQRHGSYTLSVPKTQNVRLAVYAKSPTVVRYEMQYPKQVARAVRADEWDKDAPLLTRLMAIQGDGLRRLEPSLVMLREILDDPSYAPMTDRQTLTAELADCVRVACEAENLPDQFLRTFELLLRQGGATRMPVDASVPGPVLDRLIKMGAIENLTASLKADRKSGRRYVLSDRFRPLIEGWE